MMTVGRGLGRRARADSRSGSWECTKSQIACTRAQPGGVWPNSDHAASIRRSVSQYRLASRNTSASCGSSATSCWRAAGSTASGSPLIRDQRVGENFELARRRHQAGADVAECVEIARERHRGRDAKLVGLDDVGGSRRMHVEHQHHRRARNEVVGDLEANTDFHGRSRLMPGKSTQTINPENVLPSKAGCDTGLWGSAPVTFSVALQHDFATTVSG